MIKHQIRKNHRKWVSFKKVRIAYRKVRIADIHQPQNFVDDIFASLHESVSFLVR